jgi:hypothetical protein
VDQLVLSPKWRSLHGVDPSCLILKSRGSNILHDIFYPDSQISKKRELFNLIETQRKSQLRKSSARANTAMNFTSVATVVNLDSPN